MPIRRMTTAIVCFIFATVMFGRVLPESQQHIAFAFGCGVAFGAALFAFAHGIAAWSSIRMQRHLAEEMMRNSPLLQGMHPTRNVPPVVMYVGTTEEVINKTTERK